MNPIKVIVRFEGDVPDAIQSAALLQFEKDLRLLNPNLDIRVFKDKMGDDSKLRVMMTPEQRNAL